MTYFPDLSPYEYRPGDAVPAKNVGWLDDAHAFPTGVLGEETLDRLWTACTVSINQSRGIHECELCPPGDARMYPAVERHGTRLLLGSSEIRVFGADGTLYAAPTLIYHYVTVHQYMPPMELLDALHNGALPPADEYFEWLRELGLEWGATSTPVENPVIWRPPTRQGSGTSNK
jgi:hypothetical protein